MNLILSKSIVLSKIKMNFYPTAFFCTFAVETIQRNNLKLKLENVQIMFKTCTKNFILNKQIHLTNA